MKLTKLSLVAIAVVGLSVSSFAADTLADAFKEGKVKGSVTGYYFNRDKGATDGSIFDVGVDLTYVTGSFHGFNSGFTFQSVNSPFVDEDGKAMYSGDMYGTGAQLSEAYLAYTNSGFFAKLGRQYIKTPLVAGSGSRALKQSFEAYNFGYTGLTKTTIMAGLVTKYQARTDGNGNVADFEKFAEDNAWHVYVSTKAVPNLTMNAQYAKIGDSAGDITILYADASYSIKTDIADFALAAQYKDSKDDTTDDESGDTIGLKLNAKVDNFGASLAYSVNDKDKNTNYGIGSGADNLYTATAIAGGTWDADVSAILATIDYKIGAMNFYAEYSDVDAGANKDFDIIGAGAGYKFSGDLKGLSTKVQYEVKDKEASDEDQRFRFVGTYKF